jgi:hypothetical protein
MQCPDDGATVFDHVCRLGLEGIVSKRTDAPYRSGPVEGVGQDEEPGGRGAAPGAPGAVALAMRHLERSRATALIWNIPFPAPVEMAFSAI